MKVFLERSPGEKSLTLTLGRAINKMKGMSIQDKETKQLRFVPSDIPHLNIKGWARRRAYRVISNTQQNNKFQMEATAVYQSNKYIEKFLANSHIFSNSDITCFFDQIPCDPLTSLLNTILYLGEEFDPMSYPMGAANSPLAATVIVRSLLHHHNDQLILQHMVKPRKLENKPLNQAKRTMTVNESYGSIAPLYMPACKLLFEVTKKKTSMKTNTERTFNQPIPPNTYGRKTPHKIQ